MTGDQTSSGACPVCGGPLHQGAARIPYDLDKDAVIIVKKMPAKICGDCHESFTSGVVTDRITVMLSQLKCLGSEVSVITYSEYEMS